MRRSRGKTTAATTKDDMLRSQLAAAGAAGRASGSRTSQDTMAEEEDEDDQQSEGSDVSQTVSVCTVRRKRQVPSKSRRRSLHPTTVVRLRAVDSRAREEAAIERKQMLVSRVKAGGKQEEFCLTKLSADAERWQVEIVRKKGNGHEYRYSYDHDGVVLLETGLTNAKQAHLLKFRATETVGRVLGDCCGQSHPPTALLLEALCSAASKQLEHFGNLSVTKGAVLQASYLLETSTAQQGQEPLQRRCTKAALNAINGVLSSKGRLWAIENVRRFLQHVRDTAQYRLTQITGVAAESVEQGMQLMGGLSQEARPLLSWTHTSQVPVPTDEGSLLQKGVLRDDARNTIDQSANSTRRSSGRKPLGKQAAEFVDLTLNSVDGRKAEAVHQEAVIIHDVSDDDQS